jgi:plastocyanin
MGSRRAAWALLALLGLLLAACSNREAPVNKRPHNGTGTASMVAGVQQIVVRAGLDLRFHPSTLVVHRGLVRIILVNTANPGAGPPHDLQVAGFPAADVPLTSAGRSSSVTFTAPAPGSYSFVCSIHAAQGQTGRLIVR